MKPYIHNPDTYRHHFRQQVGGDLSGFKGARMQYGDGLGSILGVLARKAFPLLKAGAKIVAPHLKKAAKSVVKDVTGQVVQHVANKMDKKRAPPVKRLRRRKAVKGNTSKDIF